MQPILVSPQEIRGIVTMNEAVEAVRLGFRQWGENPQLNAPRRRIHIPTGVRVSVHQGGVPAAKATGLMTHCEWVKPMANEQVYPRLNHPVIVLYDAAEGELKGIIVGEITCSELPDNIAVTGLRTAATSAVGTDVLARPDASSLGIFGAAGQAKNHLLALMQVRKLKTVKVYSRNPENRKQETRHPQNVEGAGQLGQQDKCDDWPQKRTASVQCAVNGKGARHQVRRGVQRNQGITGGAADALSYPIETDYQNEPTPYASGGEQEQLANGREPVARQGDFLMAPRAVGHPSRGETDQDHRQSVVYAVDSPVLQRAQVKMKHEIDRENAVDHLGRNIGKEARHSELPNHGADVSNLAG
jgi:hypothetical protein